MALPLAVEGQSAADCHARLTVYVDQSESMAVETGGVSPEKYILSEVGKFLRDSDHPLAGGHIHLTFVPFGKNLKRTPAEVQRFDKTLISTWDRLLNERHRVDRDKTNLAAVLADIKSNEIEMTVNSRDHVVVVIASDFLHDYSPSESLRTPEKHFKSVLDEVDFCKAAVDADNFDLILVDAGVRVDKGSAFEARSYLEGCLAKKLSFMDSNRSIGDELKSRIRPFVIETWTYDHHALVQRFKVRNTWCNSAVIEAFRIDGGSVDGDVKDYELLKPEVVAPGAETKEHSIDLHKVLKDTSILRANGKKELLPSLQVTALGRHGSGLSEDEDYYETSKPLSVVLGSRLDILSARAQVDGELIRVSVTASTNLPPESTKVFIELLSAGDVVDDAWLIGFDEGKSTVASFAADLRRPTAKRAADEDYCVRLFKSPQVRFSFDGLEGIGGIHEVNLNYEGTGTDPAVLEPAKEMWQNVTVSVMFALVIVLAMGLGHGISLGMIDSKFGVLAVIISALFSIFHYGTVSGGGLEEWFIKNMGGFYILVCCIIGLLWFWVLGPALISGSGRALVWQARIRRGNAEDAIVSSSVINALILLSVPLVVALLVLEIWRDPAVADGCVYVYQDTRHAQVQQEIAK